MGEIRIVGPGKTRGYPYPVCKKKGVDINNGRKCISTIFFDLRECFDISVFEI